MPLYSLLMSAVVQSTCTYRSKWSLVVNTVVWLYIMASMPFQAIISRTQTILIPMFCRRPTARLGLCSSCLSSTTRLAALAVQARVINTACYARTKIRCWRITWVQNSKTVPESLRPLKKNIPFPFPLDGDRCLWILELLKEGDRGVNFIHTRAISDG